ncbi:hypothetical protein Hanom_Chr16g01452811 [Helianthus anomalus]
MFPGFRSRRVRFMRVRLCIVGQLLLMQLQKLIVYCEVVVCSLVQHSYDRLHQLLPFDRRIAGNYNYLIEEEIEDLVKSCGFTNYTCKVQQAFIMFSAQKP